MTSSTVPAGLTALDAAPARPSAGAGPAGRTRQSRYANERRLLCAALLALGSLVCAVLYRSHAGIEATEQVRLHGQARVIDENIGQQLDGMNRALASVRDEYSSTPVHSVSTLLSLRLKALSEAIPGVRSMILVDADGTVVATSVDTLLGRDFASRDYFRAARARPDPTTLYVAEPFRTSLETYTVVFARAISGPDGRFAGVVAAALDPEYFAVLMKSVLYAPDMRAALGHGDGKVFVTLPADPLPAAIMRIREQRQVSPPALHMDHPLAVSVSRDEAAIYASWWQQAATCAACFFLLTAGALFGLHRGQWRRREFAELQSSAMQERQRTANQLTLALQSADMGLWDWDCRVDRFEHNETTRLQLGYRPGDIGPAGGDWRGLVHPQDAARQIAAIEAHFRRETVSYECEFRVRHKEGHWVWLLSRGKVVERDAADVPVRMTGTHMDLTRRKGTEVEMERSAEMLRRIGEVADIGGWELDVASSRVVWTDQVFRIHELEPGAMPRLDGALDFYPQEARAQITASIEAAMSEGRDWDMELPFTTARGNPRWVRSQGRPVFEDGRVVRLIGAFQDITGQKEVALEMQRLNDELVRLSTTDPLTGVGNRRLLDQALQTEWQRAARRAEPLALLMIDIDHFKDYNDHYGHPAGDACLRQVARIVGASVRRGGELVARYGGEEFVLLLPGADLAAARCVAERCMQSVADAKIEHRASGTSAWLTVSIGVASQITTAEGCGQTLVDIADAALYRAKRCGRARVES